MGGQRLIWLPLQRAPIQFLISVHRWPGKFALPYPFVKKSGQFRGKPDLP
ncbi:hypothetical protein ApDm4_2659 [Acetobacter pomorum]|nr:hypothetical protein ApDm4_2659 [Acetobacter pomorum]